MKNLCLAVLVFILVVSCDKEKVFEQFHSIPGHKWYSTDAVNFNVNIDDTISSHNVLIAIRNTGQYEFSNLYLFITAVSPDGSQVRDTTEIILADDHGKWLGKGSAAVYSLYHPFRENIRFPIKGIYQFNIEQAMWIKELEHISDVGLRIEKAARK
ncbi:MAG TPA: gliding motility lipoprotein GldH [Bacteroidales bacterium]|jgi:gliding motility-associated lipoprotein GldH|nr:gliding motility lipoprotein GldH [Bacteroidales bacterium]